MRPRRRALAFLLAGCAAATAMGAEPAPRQPHEELGVLAGRWTIEGSEESYLETCEWLETYLVCRSEERSATGTSRALSVLGYSAEEGAYTHSSGFGGTPQALRGWVRNGIWTFTGQRVADGKSRRLQVTLTPTPGGFHFRQEISDDGAPWTTQYDFLYVRLP